MKSNTQRWASGLLATSALTAGGIAIESERALDAYIVESLADAEDPKTEFTARRTLEAMKATAPAYAAVLSTAALAANDPTNTDKRKAVLDAEQSLKNLIGNIYQGRNFEPQAEAMTAQVEVSRKAFGIKHPIQTGAIPLAHIQAKAIYDPGSTPFYKVATSLGALDVFSTRQSKFVYAHEAAHIAKDYMDSSGQPKVPDFSYITTDGRLARKPIENLAQEASHRITAELNADKNAVMQTCDPQAAASALATTEALYHNMTPNDLRLQLYDKLQITPGNLAHYLYAAAIKRPVPVIVTNDKKQFIEDPHPHWKDRVAAVIKTAKENCPTR